MTDHLAHLGLPVLPTARALQRAGRWADALELLPATPEGAVLRADLLVDRHLWQLDPVGEAVAAVQAVADAQPAFAAFLIAQLEYWRRLLRQDAPPVSAEDPAAALAAVSAQDPLGGWAVFWHAVALDLLHHDTPAAALGYASALGTARARGDLLLESYAVRHQGVHADSAGDRGRAVALLRRSLQLRAALGARPHTAAAQAALADVLGPGAESDELRALAAGTADELDLAWLKAAA